MLGIPIKPKVIDNFLFNKASGISLGYFFSPIGTGRPSMKNNGKR